MSDLPKRLKGATVQALESAQQQLDDHMGRYERVVKDGLCPCQDCNRARQFIKEAKS